MSSAAGSVIKRLPKRLQGPFQTVGKVFVRQTKSRVGSGALKAAALTVAPGSAAAMQVASHVASKAKTINKARKTVKQKKQEAQAAKPE